MGATVNYYFGKIEKNRLQITEDIIFGTVDQRRSDVDGFDFNYGMTYSPKFGKYNLFSSLRVNTQANLVSVNEQQVGSVVAANLRPIEIFDVDLEEENLKKEALLRVKK